MSKPPALLPTVFLLLSPVLLNGCTGLIGSRSYCERVAQERPSVENEKAMQEWNQIMDNCSGYLVELDRDEDSLLKQDMDSQGRPLPHR